MEKVASIVPEKDEFRVSPLNEAYRQIGELEAIFTSFTRLDWMISPVGG